MKKSPNYPRFAGMVMGKAWCTIYGELYPDESPLTPEDIMSYAEECGISTKPPPGFIQNKRSIENLLKRITTT